MTSIVEPFQGSSVDWDRLAEQFRGTVFHLAGWLRTIERAYGHGVERLAAVANGNVTGLLPLVRMRVPFQGTLYVSTPFADSGGIIGSTADAIQTLYTYTQERSRTPGVKRVTLRQLTPVNGMTASDDKVTLQLPLPSDEETLWTSFPAKVRNQVRKAEKHDITVQHTDDVAGFYDVFRRVMHGLGSPTHGRALFTALLEECGDHARIYTAHLNGDVIGGAVAMRFGSTWAVPWAACLFEHRSLCVNNLLYWTMLKTAVAEGYTVFDYGRSTPGEGTYKFKKQWGAEDVPLYWHSWVRGAASDAHRSISGNSNMADRWRSMPLPVANVLGPIIRKRLDN